MKTSNKKLLLWTPLAAALVLNQCESKKETSSQPPAEAVRENQPVPPVRQEALPKSLPAGEPAVAPPTNAAGQATASTPAGMPVPGEVPEFERKMTAYQAAMEESIVKGDAGGLIRSFNSAVVLYGGSSSSPTAVLSGIMSNLSEDLDMARALIDSMGDGPMVASNAYGLAQAIENEDQRLQWVASLANVRVRDEVMKLMPLETGQ